MNSFFIETSDEFYIKRQVGFTIFAFLLICMRFAHYESLVFFLCILFTCTSVLDINSNKFPVLATTTLRRRLLQTS